MPGGSKHEPGKPRIGNDARLVTTVTARDEKLRGGCACGKRVRSGQDIPVRSRLASAAWVVNRVEVARMPSWCPGVSGRCHVENPRGVQRGVWHSLTQAPRPRFDRRQPWPRVRRRSARLKRPFSARCCFSSVGKVRIDSGCDLAHVSSEAVADVEQQPIRSIGSLHHDACRP
jgi:hypothetical protein